MIISDNKLLIFQTFAGIRKSDYQWRWIGVALNIFVLIRTIKYRHLNISKINQLPSGDLIFILRLLKKTTAWWWASELHIQNAWNPSHSELTGSTRILGILTFRANRVSSELLCQQPARKYTRILHRPRPTQLQNICKQFTFLHEWYLSWQWSV